MNEKFFPDLLKFVPKNLSFYTELKKKPNFLHRKNFLSDFYPISILPWNISANDGLCKSLNMLLDIAPYSVFKSRIILKV